MNSIQRFINRATDMLSNVRKTDKGNKRGRPDSTEESRDSRTGNNRISHRTSRRGKEKSDERQAIRASKAVLQPLREGRESQEERQVRLNPVSLSFFFVICLLFGIFNEFFSISYQFLYGIHISYLLVNFALLTVMCVCLRYIVRFNKGASV